MQDDEDINPYQSPLAVSSPESDSEFGAEKRGLHRKFRQQIHALGGVWIIIGSLFCLALRPTHTGTDSLWVLGAIGVVWLLLGVFACLKQMWAVYVGLVLSYILLVGDLILISVIRWVILIGVIGIGLAILAVLILQAHRVIRWAKTLREAGIELTAKP
jgi:hypothetical protein